MLRGMPEDQFMKNHGIAGTPHPNEHLAGARNLRSPQGPGWRHAEVPFVQFVVMASGVRLLFRDVAVLILISRP